MPRSQIWEWREYEEQNRERERLTLCIESVWFGLMETTRIWFDLDISILCWVFGKGFWPEVGFVGTHIDYMCL